MSDDEFMPELEKQFQEEKSKLDNAESVNDFKNIIFRLLQGKQNLSIGIMDLEMRLEDIEEELSSLKSQKGS